MLRAARRVDVAHPGVKVVPVDYRLSHEELTALFDKLSGLYLPGDSHMTINDEKYKFAFMAMLDYCLKRTEVKDHFPIFMMGNSLQTLVRSRKTGQHLLTSMEHVQYRNLMIKMADGKQTHDTYFFDRMTREDRQAVFNAGKFFNSQAMGLRLRELDVDQNLRRLLTPIAIYRIFDKDGNHVDKKKKHFVAIAEGKTMPLYVFTYDIEAI